MHDILFQGKLRCRQISRGVRAIDIFLACLLDGSIRVLPRSRAMKSFVGYVILVFLPPASLHERVTRC
jgi:hypothetical protein